MKSKAYKTGRLWKYIVLRDDDGKEIKKVELDENQKLKRPRICHKKRKLDHQSLTFAVPYDFYEKKENDSNHFAFHKNSHENDYFSAGCDFDFLPITTNTNIDFGELDKEEEYFREVDSNANVDFQDNFFRDDHENLGGMLL